MLMKMTQQGKVITPKKKFHYVTANCYYLRTFKQKSRRFTEFYIANGLNLYTKN